MPVALPKGVEITVSEKSLMVKGPLGSLTQALTGRVKIVREGDTLTFAPANDEASADAMSGTVRAIVANMVNGVTKGFERRLNLVGVGYRAQAQGDKLNLSLGFSHPVVHSMPKGVKVETPTQTEIVIKGMDSQLVGQVAAEVRAYRPPEPYKGKGVRYSDERVVLKETKKK
jgi:large subunit ribosomal protein L6